jgi:hypothetical protein
LEQYQFRHLGLAMDKPGNCRGFTTKEFVVNWASLGKCKISTSVLA